MDALELALRCSSLLLRTMTKTSTSSGSSAAGFGGVGSNGDADIVKVKSDSDAESQFKTGSMQINTGLNMNEIICTNAFSFQI